MGVFRAPSQVIGTNSVGDGGGVRAGQRTKRTMATTITTTTAPRSQMRLRFIMARGIACTEHPEFCRGCS